MGVGLHAPSRACFGRAVISHDSSDCSSENRLFCSLEQRANALDLSTVQALNKLSAIEHPVDRC